MANCRDKGIRSSGQVPWNQTFMFAIWMIWKGRNQLVFENKNLKTSLAMDINQRALEYFHCVGKPVVANHKILKQVRWDKPCCGWLKLNTDTRCKWQLDEGVLLEELVQQTASPPSFGHFEMASFYVDI